MWSFITTNVLYYGDNLDILRRYLRGGAGATRR
jgi:hypothetical protein